jgi:hypothetical protein
MSTFRRFVGVTLGAAAGALALPATAQVGEFKPTYAGYEYLAPAELRAPDAAPDAEASFHTFEAGVGVPLLLDGENSFLVPGLRYQLMDVSIAGDGGDSAEVDALHSMLASVGYYQRFSERWAMFALLGAGFASDFEASPNSDDLVVSAQAIGLYQFSRDFTLGAGVGYDRRTGDVTPLPLLALDFQPSERFMIKGVVPASLGVRYRVLPPLTLGLEAALDGERYNLHAGREGDETVEVAYSAVKLGVSATVHATKSLHARVLGGAALRRRFEVFVDDESLGDIEVAPGPFVGLELWFGQSGWRSDEPAKTP